jgi:hypothetical protein
VVVCVRRKYFSNQSPASLATALHIKIEHHRVQLTDNRRVYTAALVDRHVCQQPIHADCTREKLKQAIFNKWVGR